MGATSVHVTETTVALRDGTRLATELALPDDGGPRPALVIRGPYSRQAIRSSEDILAHARAGWAVVAQDVRGRFDSGGTFDPWHQEGPDGADVISWVAAQPWCDGRVAMTGTSYLGMTQLRAALEQPAALRAIAPVVPGGDVRDGWLYEGGALRLAFAAPYAVTLSTGPESDEQAAALREIADDWSEVLRTPLGRSPLRGVVPPFDRWLDADEEYWRPLDVIAQAERIVVPSFLVAGWFDLFCEDTLGMHTALVDGAGSERARRGQRLVIGPWTHVGIYAPVTPGFDFGPEANGVLEGIPAEQLAWLRRAVDGEDVEGGVRAYLTGAEPGPGGRWREWPAWPPRAEEQVLYLGSDGRATNSANGGGTLTSPAPAEAGRQPWRHDPDDPVPSVGGRSLGPFRPPPGPVDQREVEMREDVLVFTSRPLEEALEIGGVVVADLVVASSAPSTDVAVKLVDVWPAGVAYNVVDSVTRTELDPGEPTVVRVHVGSCLHRFAAGHRVRIQVASSNFPRLDVNPHSGEPAATATEWLAATGTLHHGGPEPSRIRLPVLSR